MAALAVLILTCLLLSLTHASQAFTFSPNCTLPPPGATYVHGPDVRSTLSILWNCLSIILLCTWNIQHRNVPLIRPRAKSTWQKLWWIVLDLRAKTKWMIVTIFVPEYLMGKAFVDLCSARENVGAMAGIVKDKPGVEWELVHAHMANMGYFVLDSHFEGDVQSCGGKSVALCTSDKARVAGDEERGGVTRRGMDGNTTGIWDGFRIKFRVGPFSILYVTGRPESTHPAVKPGEYNYLFLFKWQPSPGSPYFFQYQVGRPSPHKKNELPPDHRYLALDARQWLQVFEEGWADPPDISAQHLEKLDKGGALVKALAVLQIAYLVVQLIGRQVSGLPTSQLEIAALAFSASSMVTYFLYWNRPQGVDTIHIVKCKQPIPDRRYTLLLLAELGPMPIYHIEPNSKLDKIASDFESVPMPIPNDGLHQVKRPLTHAQAMALGAYLGGALFGALHLLAWRFHFPTAGEALGWRICAVATTAIPGVLAVLSVTRILFLPEDVPVSRRPEILDFMVMFFVSSSLFFPYVAARLFLLVEVVRDLFFLPPEAFIETWSGSLPHWG